MLPANPMRKTLALLLFLLISPVLAFGASEWTGTSLLTYTASTTVSVGIGIPRGLAKMALIIPTTDSSTIAVHGSYDGSTYYAIYYDAGAAAAPAAWLVGATTGGIAVEIPDTAQTFNYIRVVCGSAQNANRSFRFVGRYK